MFIRDIISKKAEKKELTEEEIRFFIFGFFKDEISQAQAASLMTLMHIYGLSIKEMKYMTSAIAETGAELEFYRISNKVTDIHSLGGTSDKIILILLSVINALGYEACKIIGRELGMEDRLLSIEGYKMEENIKDFTLKPEMDRVAIYKSIHNLAPIEDKLYKLRHEIACDNNIKLIAISIMSQKIALGFKNIFFEITYGKNAYVKTLSEAKTLSKYLVDIGKEMMRNVSCCIRPLNQPIGNTFGNIIELKEIYDALNGNISNDLEEIVLEYGSAILSGAEISKDISYNKKIIKETITDGRALESFKKMIANRNGNIRLLEEDIKVENVIPITSDTTGYVSEIDVNKLRMVSRYLHAIRTNQTDELDIGAGVVFNKKIGDYIGKGEIIAYLYTNNSTKINDAVTQIREMFKISEKRIKLEPIISYK